MLDWIMDSRWGLVVLATVVTFAVMFGVYMLNADKEYRCFDQLPHQWDRADWNPCANGTTLTIVDHVAICKCPEAR